ncbi:MAG: hypothetical protein WCV59_00170 [Parcubacteria group bacterium]|jgi:hypothetical protein
MFPNQFQRNSYQPKKPVKSFQDLEVYQKSLEASVFVAKTLVPGIIGKGKKAKLSGEANKMIIEALLPTALGLPHLIAEAHSLRFGSSLECLARLEKTMMNCNKLIVYVEQARDISETGIEWEQFDEQIKKYLYIRRKVLNLQRSWKKFIEINKSQQ